MADDVQPITGTSARVAARLCNFTTGHSTLLPAHVTWLDGQVQPVVASSANPWVDLIGYASRLGSSAANQRYSQERCDAVRARIATYSAKVTFPQDYGVGESESTGDADDNSGYWRAVDVLVYGAKPAVRPPPPKPIDPNAPLKNLVKVVGDFLNDLQHKLPFGGTIVSKLGIKIPAAVRLLNADEQREAMTIFVGSSILRRFLSATALGLRVGLSLAPWKSAGWDGSSL
jgi:hypothetical protein